MNEYLVVKWLHILSSTFLFGTGIGSAFYMLFAGLNREPRIVFFVTRYVVIADWLFTTTAVIVQPLTGFYLVYLAGIPLTSSWIVWSTALRMRDMARIAAAQGTPLPPRYWHFFRLWVLLGIPAFFSLVIVFYLMVAKPV
jgi:uncharacterized membrane protein